MNSMCFFVSCWDLCVCEKHQDNSVLGFWPRTTKNKSCGLDFSTRDVTRTELFDQRIQIRLFDHKSYWNCYFLFSFYTKTIEQWRQRTGQDPQINRPEKKSQINIFVFDRGLELNNTYEAKETKTFFILNRFFSLFFSNLSFCSVLI